MEDQKIPTPWVKWCSTGKHGVGNRKKNAVLKCLKSGHVRGYFSDIPLRPELDNTHSMYPSFEHLVDPKNHADAVVEARIINDMKSHLTEGEFWRVVEHLFVVGLEKGKIRSPFGKLVVSAKRDGKRHGPAVNQTRRGACVGSAERSERSQPHARASAVLIRQCNL